MIIGARINADLHSDPAPPWRRPATGRPEDRLSNLVADRRLSSHSARHTGAGNFAGGRAGAPSPGAASWNSDPRRRRTAQAFPSRGMLDPESPNSTVRVGTTNARPVARSRWPTRCRAAVKPGRTGWPPTQRNRFVTEFRPPTPTSWAPTRVHRIRPQRHPAHPRLRRHWAKTWGRRRGVVSRSSRREHRPWILAAQRVGATLRWPSSTGHRELDLDGLA